MNNQPDLGQALKKTATNAGAAVVQVFENLQVCTGLAVHLPMLLTSKMACAYQRQLGSHCAVLCRWLAVLQSRPSSARCSGSLLHS